MDREKEGMKKGEEGEKGGKEEGGREKERI